MGVLFVFPSTNSGNMFGVLFSAGFEPAKAVIFVRDLAGPKRTSPESLIPSVQVPVQGSSALKSRTSGTVVDLWNELISMFGAWEPFWWEHPGALRWSFGRGFSLKQAGWSWWNSIAQPQEFPASSHDFSARQPAHHRPGLLLLLVHRLLRSAGELAGDRRDLSAAIPRSGASRAQVARRQGGCGCPAESWMGLREICRKP